MSPEEIRRRAAAARAKRGAPPKQPSAAQTRAFNANWERDYGSPDQGSPGVMNIYRNQYRRRFGVDPPAAPVHEPPSGGFDQAYQPQAAPARPARSPQEIRDYYAKGGSHAGKMPSWWSEPEPPQPAPSPQPQENWGNLGRQFDQKPQQRPPTELPELGNRYSGETFHPDWWKSDYIREPYGSADSPYKPIEPAPLPPRGPRASDVRSPPREQFQPRAKSAYGEAASKMIEQSNQDLDQFLQQTHRYLQQYSPIGVLQGMQQMREGKPKTAGILYDVPPPPPEMRPPTSRYA